MSKCNFEFYQTVDDLGWVPEAYQDNDDGTTTFWMRERSDVKTSGWKKVKFETSVIVPAAVFDDKEFSITF